MCIVVNKYRSSYDVYIGRGSKWGNPFVIGKHGNREQVIAQYKRYLWSQIKSGQITLGDLIELDGKKLGCFCKPKSCHGDVIVAAVDWAKSRE